jgi:hypothetical protein
MSTSEFEGLSNSDVWGSAGPKVTPTGVKALYIANIGRAPQRDIEKLVEPYGKVQRIEMKSNYCFVYFSEDTAVEAYEHAIAALNRQRLGSQSRILTAEWARGTAPASISRLQESEKTLGGEDSITGGDGACLENSVTTSKTLFVVNFDPDEITSRDLLTSVAARFLWSSRRRGLPRRTEIPPLNLVLVRLCEIPQGRLGDRDSILGARGHWIVAQGIHPGPDAGGARTRRLFFLRCHLDAKLACGIVAWKHRYQKRAPFLARKSPKVNVPVW